MQNEPSRYKNKSFSLIGGEGGTHRVTDEGTMSASANNCVSRAPAKPHLRIQKKDTPLGVSFLIANVSGPRGLVLLEA